MCRKDIVNKVKLGMNREDVKEILGRPSKFARDIFFYDEIELHFSYGKNGFLIMIYSENET
jgi:hypothetical protein